MDLKRLKRFAKDKHDQLEQLLAWSQMMGLTGQDLVSLGGHIARSEARQKALANRAAVDALGCQPIGKDDNIEHHGRWKFRSGGNNYWFEHNGYGQIKVTNTRNKFYKIFRVDINDHELGRMHWRRRHYYATMLMVLDGAIVLDF
jgi:hypothetical protein